MCSLKFNLQSATVVYPFALYDVLAVSAAPAAAAAAAAAAAVTAHGQDAICLTQPQSAGAVVAVLSVPHFRSF